MVLFRRKFAIRWNMSNATVTCKERKELIILTHEKLRKQFLILLLNVYSDYNYRVFHDLYA